MTAFLTIKQTLPKAAPRLGLILGSGLGALAKTITSATDFPYESLPEFLACSVTGHSGILRIGKLGGLEVACLQGRPHWYEGVSARAFHTPIDTLKQLGCDTLMLINAAGSLHPDVGPGDLMLIKDHINFQFNNPLVGITDIPNHSRFVSMENAYDSALRTTMLSVAQQLNIPLTEGIYVGTLGPSFETPAEIRAYQRLGADVVGMSTLPEVILARYYGLRVIVVSAITNKAAGLSNQQLTHDLTLKGAALATEKLSRLILAFVEQQY